MQGEPKNLKRIHATTQGKDVELKLKRKCSPLTATMYTTVDPTAYYSKSKVSRQKKIRRIPKYHADVLKDRWKFI